jgi:hypothetical protein
MQAVETTKIRTSKATQVTLQEGKQKRKTLLDLQNTCLMRGTECLIESVTLHLTACDRITNTWGFFHNRDAALAFGLPSINEREKLVKISQFSSGGVQARSRFPVRD